MDNELPKFYDPLGKYSSQEEANRRSEEEYDRAFRAVHGGRRDPDHQWLQFDDNVYFASIRRLRKRSEAREAISTNGVDITDLTPQEVVALYRLTDDELAQTEAGAAWQHDPIGLHARLRCTLENMPILDREHSKGQEIFAAFADSPLADDRKRVAEEFLMTFTKYRGPGNHAQLWDQLMRDPNKEVRDTAERQLTQVLVDSRSDRRRRPARGMYAVDQASEARLQEHGLTLEDANSLMESFAYAENGQYHYLDLGHAALSKIVVPGQPQD